MKSANYVMVAPAIQVALIIDEFNKYSCQDMDSEEGRKTWNEQKIKLKLRYTWLKDSDLEFEDGKKEEMLGHLQIKLGKTKEQLQSIIDTL